MTGMLASIKNLREAEFVLNANVDIIDLKQPEFGALGALPVELVAEIVQKSTTVVRLARRWAICQWTQM